MLASPVTAQFYRCIVILLSASGPVLLTPISAATIVFIPSQAAWKFQDNGEVPSVEWIQPSFDDTSWDEGPAPLGYGEPGVIATPTAPGTMTNYFRHSFQLTNLPTATNVVFRLWRDDRAKVYLNGELVFDDGERQGEWIPPHTGSIPTDRLQLGKNLVAIEVQQSAFFSSDLVFDFELQDTNATVLGIAITSPINASLVRAGVDLPVRAIVSGFSNAPIVNFYANSQWFGFDAGPPYEAVWPKVPLGEHFLRAVILSPAFNLTSAPVRITAVSNLPPLVHIDNPLANSVVAAGDVSIVARAIDPDGSVTNVTFFEQGVALGTVTAPPFQLTWQNVPDGEYFLTARATDNGGLNSTSSVIRVNVRTSTPTDLKRGPYLQLGTPTSIIIKWRTSEPSTSRVRYGTNQNDLNQQVTADPLVTDHRVRLTGLTPDTRYWYEIGTLETELASGPDFRFTSAPTQPKPTRIWAIGDSGTATPDAQKVATAYRNFTGERNTDLWLMLGDNAYGSGSDTEYQEAVFDFYPTFLRQTVLWPTLGNHEVSPAYHDIFTLPTQGEAGGMASGTESYYSFDYGNIHFVCLDATFSERGPNSPMCAWLQADLEANTNQWLIAFWHQPPYSKGSHDSDTELELVEMRENAVPILEQFGADLILGGHSHSYERSHFLNGHYGHSSTLNRETMFVDGGDGRSDGDGAYRKATIGPHAGRGAVYVVAGSSGWASFSALDHPVMHASFPRMGSFVIDVDGPRLDAKFLNLLGQVDDYFTVVKDTADLRVTAVQFASGDVTLSWISRPGKRYKILYAPTPAELPTAISDILPATGTATTYVHHTPAGTPIGFYRVQELP